jgi:hypothetical protein
MSENEIKEAYQTVRNTIIKVIREPVKSDFLKELSERVMDFVSDVRRDESSTKALFDANSDMFEKVKTNVSKVIKAYISGNVMFAYRSMSLWLSVDESLQQNLLFKTFNIYNSTCDDIWYKARRIDAKSVKPDVNGMKNIPLNEINLRRGIGNNRYSVSGYPCIYVGKTEKDCFYELRKPEDCTMWVSEYIVRNVFYLLDLRIERKCTTEDDLKKYIFSAPYIIACSLRVPDKYDDRPFKPEYIFPELLMNRLLQFNFLEEDFNRNHPPIGVIYNSVQCDYGKDNLKEFENIAIPVRKLKNPGGHLFHIDSDSLFEVEPPKLYKTEDENDSKNT